MKLNTNEFKFLKFLVVVLFLSTFIGLATETTWRHPGFEVTQFDINFTGLNATNIWVQTFKANGTPPVSAANKISMFYDSIAGHFKYSENGAAYKEAFNNATEVDRGTLADARLTANVTLNNATTIDKGTLNSTILGSDVVLTSNTSYLKNTTVLNTTTVTVGRNSNGSIELTATDVTNTSYLKNTTVLNTTTVTVGRNPNGSIELTTTVTGGGFTNQNVSGSRVKDTVYFNENTTARLVSIGATAVICDYYTDASNPPTTKVARQTANGAVTTFLVLPNNYYKLTEVSACAVVTWTEWN